VTLPTTEPDVAGPGLVSAAPHVLGRTRAHVLVVDDEPAIVNTLRELLGLEHEVVVATSGGDALALLADVRLSRSGLLAGPRTGGLLRGIVRL